MSIRIAYCLKLGVVLLVALSLTGCGSCFSRPEPKYVQVPSNGGGNTNVTATSNLAGQNLDLQAVIALVKQAKNGEDLERLLNQPGSVNNLDLDGDGQVDYIRVEEYQGGNTKNFSLTAQLPSGQVQEVAQIQIEQQPNQQAVVQVQGNQTIYGPSVYYTSSFPLAEVLFLAWVFSPRPAIYISPYHYGYYPSYYRVYTPVPVATYRTTTRTYTRTVTTRQATQPAVRTTAVSPNANRTASNIRAPVYNPSGTQRQFQNRPDNRPVGSGGFGRPGAPTTSPTSRPPTSSAPATRPAPPAARPSPPPPPRPAPSRPSFTSRGRRG